MISNIIQINEQTRPQKNKTTPKVSVLSRRFRHVYSRKTVIVFFVIF